MNKNELVKNLVSMPVIFEESQYGVATMDLSSKLLSSRIVLLYGPIDETMAEIIIPQLLYLDSLNCDPIHMYISSPGGSIDAGFSIIDVMHFIESPVYTYGLGMVASMASLILMAGEPNYRSATLNSRILIHQPLGGTQGQAEDIIRYAEDIKRIKNKIISFMYIHTGREFDKIAEDIDRDNIMYSYEAKNYGEYGIIDKVINMSSRKANMYAPRFKKLKEIVKEQKESK